MTVYLKPVYLKPVYFIGRFSFFTLEEKMYAERGGNLYRKLDIEVDSHWVNSSALVIAAMILFILFYLLHHAFGIFQIKMLFVPQQMACS
jgi:hypothetical protein